MQFMAAMSPRAVCNVASLGSFSSRRATHGSSRRENRRSMCVRAEVVEEMEANEEGTSSSSSPMTASVPSTASYKVSEPRRFYVRPDKFLDIAGGALNFPFRLGTGAFVSGYQVKLVPAAEVPADVYTLGELAGYRIVETSNLGQRPEKPIEIYEFEGCPFCKKVREIVSVLDLDVLYYPCPKGGPNFRPKAIKMGGKKQFPYMVDPNTGVSMYESDDIIKYLVDKYGDGKIPVMLSLGLFTTLTAGFAMIGRAGKGSKYVSAKLPKKPIELWAYEASPFCKIVREALVELELPHILHSAARGSPARTKLFQRIGIFQAPYIEDPNTGVKMFESADIVDYLRAEYALPEAS